MHITGWFVQELLLKVILLSNPSPLPHFAQVRQPAQSLPSLIEGKMPYLISLLLVKPYLSIFFPFHFSLNEKPKEKTLDLLIMSDCASSLLNVEMLS